ncbi:hypothetical protein DPEC_G00048040 [Dallia pectoralis]|uniref:Uncharacterized protein n=1 Tax=Dallia pectoralis TaxID=75939 RepID=A0ACC2HAE9_DALPE|nr:hypothetical protein DPEC_G00048040 [Dallia pectoralis]
MQKDGSFAWIKCNTTPSLICEYTLTQMPQGEKFKFRVMACNTGGPGEPAEVPGIVTVTEMLEKPDHELEAKYKDVFVVRYGGVIKLSVPIKGKPVPTCKWTKENAAVPEKAMIASSDDCTELVIKGAERTDSGTYDLQLENMCGKKSVHIKVKVISRPAAPEGPLRFEDIQAQSVKLAWKAPLDDGGSEILGYIVERQQVPKTAWYTVDTRVSDTCLVVKGLEEGQQYNFKVTAENTFGISGSLKSTEPLLPKTPLCPPETSSIPPEVMDVTKSSASLSWSRPKDDGGSAITGYFVEYKEASSETWVRHEKKVVSTQFTVPGLTADAEYQFRVIAQNDIGNSEPGPASEPVTCKDPFDKPSQPGEIDTVTVTKDSVTIKWTAPECDGGKAILGYWVECRKSAEATWKKCNKTSTKEKQFSMTGLAEATEYEFRVMAENETGISRPRRTATCIKTKLGAGTQPSLRKEMDEVTAKLYQPAVMKCQIIGRPVPDIKWYKSGKEIIESRKYEMSSDGRNHSLTIMTDQQEDEGEYRCKAINDVGEAETSGVLVLETAPQFNPDFPLKDTYYAESGTTLRMHVAYIGRPEPKIMWLYGATTLEASENISIENTEYYTHLVIKSVKRSLHGGKYRVRLHNHFGRTETVITVHIKDKPAVPEGPIILDALLKNSVIISWKPPKDDGGSMITNYIVEKREDKEGDDWTLVSSSITGTNCRIPNLVVNAGYFFRVYAQNRYGNSEPLDISAPILIKSSMDKPSPPLQPVASGLTNNSCVVSWKPPLSDGGSKIKCYCLEMKQKKGEWTPVTSDEIKTTVFSVKHLTEGSEYIFRVNCENLGGASDWSVESGPVVPKTPVDVRAPAFKEELRNMSVKYKSNATFVCKISGQPKPVIKWFKRGKEIQSDGMKLKIQEFKGGYHQLVVFAADEEDSTVYQIRATNQGGSICATVSLDVEIPATINLPKNLKDKEAIPALRGEIVNIKIPFTGKPDPVITWQKGQDLIDNNGYYQVIVTRSFTSLVFPNGVDRKDAGFYIVCAKNRFGIDQQTVELDVADVPDPPRGIKASDVSRDSVSLTWQVPANDGGSRVSSYVVEKCPTTADRWERVAQTRDTRYTIINLFGGTSYQFRVIAESKFGQSQPSDPSGPVTTKEDKSRVLGYDSEVSDRDVPSRKAPHSDAENVHTKYMIAEELGRGQFGIVHRCVEITSKRTYMAKFVKVRGADQAIIKKEIATLNLARHNNFLCLHESFDSSEELVMIYDFVSGQDIFERLGTADFELNEREIANYIRQVCEALAFLHNESFGHFDIRPENIVFTTRKGSKIKIIELGQARHLTPGDQMKVQFTTAEYAAPEIHQNDMVSTVTDMWSVGVLVYVLLSGLNPFTAETHQQTIDNISNAEYSYDDETFKVPTVEALDFINRLLTKERKHRMSAAQALEHPWLKMPAEELSATAISTTRHKRYYQAMTKKEWATVVSGARVASGGAIRAQRGVTVAKVKIAPFEHGPVGGQIINTVVDVGADVKFACNIDNYDSATEVTWYYGVRQLEASDKYEIEYEDGLAVICIKGVTKTDDGTYRCKIVNEYGEDSAYGELFVNGVRSYREHFTARVVKKVKRRVDTARLLQKPPEFTLPLFNHAAYIGEHVRFSVTITVHPEPRVIWYKSGQKISPGDDDKKYTFITDKGLYQLVIHSVDANDDAEYSVVARNKFGDDSCKAHLTVTPRPAPADTTLRPMFKRLLANVECREGQNARFEIRVSGLPTLKWEKDGMPLAFGPQIEVVHEGLDYFVLHVKDTLPEDSGCYRVTATNSAGSASCQAILKVDRVTHVKKVYESEKDKKKQAEKEEIEKKVRLSQIMAGTDVMPLPSVAQQALREAALLCKPVVTKKDKTEVEDKKRAEERAKRAEEKRLRMPYDVPQPRVRGPTALLEDMEIKHYIPCSDMKWYKKLRDQYEFPEPIEKVSQKRLKRIRLSRWDQFYEVPLPRIKESYKPKWRLPQVSQDDLETVRPSRQRTPSPELEAYPRIRRRSLGDLLDEELLMPINEYLAMKKTEEARLQLEEELELGYSASPPSLSPVRFQLGVLRHTSPKHTVYEDKEEGEKVRAYDKYRIPSKFEAGPSYVDLRQRHDKATFRPPRESQRVFEEKEDQEMLRNVKTTQIITVYKGELKRMEFEEKTKTHKKEKTTTSHVSTFVATKTEGRRSPTPERTRPRSPSPVVTARSSSRSKVETVQVAKVDHLARYESRKAVLRSERRSVERKEVVSMQPFSLDHTPRVTVRMRSHRVPFGQHAKFTLNVQSKPTAEVKWYHNGQLITESRKYSMSNLSGVLYLQIRDCTTEDSGTYRVVCTNTIGECSDYATLYVAGMGEYSSYMSPREDEEPPALPEATKKGAYQISSSSTTVKSVETHETHVESSTFVKKKTTLPATILTKPQSLTVNEGESARFACDFDGEPVPTVTWMYEGQIITSSVRHYVSTEQYKSMFEISSVEMSDEGTYSILVENSEGSQEAKFSLTIRRLKAKEETFSRVSYSDEEPTMHSPSPVMSPSRVKSPVSIRSPQRVKSPTSPPPTSSSEKVALKSKPSISSGLQDVTTSADSIVKLTVKMNGHPKPEISWMKDGKLLIQGGKYDINEEQDLAQLQIYNSETSDSGVYKCTVTNSAGSSSTSCTVCIQASNKTKALATKTEISEQVMKKEVIYGEVEPYTEVKASHTQMSMSEGQSVTLRANIPGASDIRWILNGMELANSADYRYGVSGDDHIMTIKKVSQYEQGVITCEAKTEQGLVKCQFNTTITAARSGAPSFVVQPRSQNVNQGLNVKFTCEIAGEPAPEIEWLKDNIIVSMSSNMKLSRSKNVYTLEIFQATVADSGKYTIKAQNQYGQCSATSSLNVITLVEEPVRMIIMEQSPTAASLTLDSFSASSVNIAEASMVHESSFQSKFKSMSAASMSTMTSKSVVSTSSSSLMESSSEIMSSHAISKSMRGSSRSSLTHGGGKAPKIESFPEDMSIEQGKLLSLPCAFSGDPTPAVEWICKGKKCDKESDRFHIETTEDLTTLVIPCVKKDDAGVYTLKLSNELGSAMATVNIHIRSM